MKLYTFLILEFLFFIIVGFFTIQNHEMQHYRTFELYGCENITLNTFSVDAVCHENKEEVRKIIAEQENYNQLSDTIALNMIWFTLFLWFIAWRTK
jgi:hypothetical protein